MKKVLSLCLSLIFILAACQKSSDNRVSIAILVPVSHPSFEQIEKGFRQTMEAANPGKYHFVTYNAQGNKTLMRSEIEEIVQKEYPLVFTLGTSASQMTAEVFSKKGLKTAIVFTCVNDPVGFRIIPSDYVTGVKEMLAFDEELAALLRYKPEVKNILLVYNPSEPGLQKDQKEIERILKEENISLKTVEVFQTNELLSKVSPAMDSIDAVIVLKDSSVVSGLDLLVKLCDRYKVPLMASDLDSPDRGAAFGYGVYEIEFGNVAAKKALQILENGTSPGSIPVTPVSEFHLRVNAEAARKQGILLP